MSLNYYIFDKDMKKVATVYIVQYLWTSFKSKLIQSYEILHENYKKNLPLCGGVHLINIKF